MADLDFAAVLGGGLRAAGQQVRTRSTGTLTKPILGSRVGVIAVDGLKPSWFGSVLDFEVEPTEVCGVEYAFPWQAFMFPYRPVTRVMATIRAKGPSTLPAAFARVDWQFTYFEEGSGNPWPCRNGSGRTGPDGAMKVPISAPRKLVQFGPPFDARLSGGFLNCQVYRLGQMMAVSGMPSEVGSANADSNNAGSLHNSPTVTHHLSAAILFTDSPNLIGQAPPVF